MSPLEDIGKLPPIAPGLCSSRYVDGGSGHVFDCELPEKHPGEHKHGLIAWPRWPLYDDAPESPP